MPPRYQSRPAQKARGHRDYGPGCRVAGRHQGRGDLHGKDGKRFLLGAAFRLGCKAHLRISRRWHQRPHRRPRSGGRPLRFRPGPARRNGGLHGLRPRQVHRRARRLSCHLGARRHPPAERALRRADGSSAGAGDRRAAGADRTRRPLPAGSRPRVAVQGCRRRIRPHGDDTGAGSPADRPRGAHRQGRAHRHLHHHAERPAGDGRGRIAAAKARRDTDRHRLRGAGCRPGGEGARPRRPHPQRRQEGRDPGRGRRAARDRRGHRNRRQARRRGRQGAARQGRIARRSALCDRVDRAARHASELRDDDRVRHPVHDRVAVSLYRIPARGRPGPRRPDRPRPENGQHALPDGGQPDRRQRQDPAQAAAAARPQARPVVARDDRKERHELVGGAEEPGDEQRATDQSAARLLGIVAAPAGEVHYRLRHRLGHQLVRPRRQNPPRHDGLGVGLAGDDGSRHALRDRREIRLSRPGRARPLSATARCR